MRAVEAKWRPSLGLITTALIAGALILPLVGLVFFRLYENQLVRQTESELIAQAAMLSAVYAREIEAAPEGVFPIGGPRPPIDPARVVDERYAPIPPMLDLALATVGPSRPDPVQPARPITPDAILIGQRLERIARDTQVTTLAGFRVLDADGTAIAGRFEIGRSFAELPEVRDAMGGMFAATLRMRHKEEAPPPLYSISRGTRIRVFVAMPVFVDDRVRGVVYVSRTPDHILRNLYAGRERLALAAALILAAAAVIGWAFVRTITRPVRALVRRAEAIAQGDRTAIGPLDHHGTDEIAVLTQSFMTMAARLSDRSDYLGTFAAHVTHELKTPLTAIRGAAELLRDNADAMTPEERQRFLANVLADAERMTALLERLRDLARADNPELGGSTTLEAVTTALRQQFETLEIVLEGERSLAMSQENAMIVFANLLDNALNHGAKRIVLEGGADRVLVRDDGPGVSPGNRERIFDPFFTTRRAEGGAGMGLGIVRALLRAHGGDIRLEDSDAGATFAVVLPTEAVTPARSSAWDGFTDWLRKFGR